MGGILAVIAPTGYRASTNTLLCTMPVDQLSEDRVHPVCRCGLPLSMGTHVLPLQC